MELLRPSQSFHISFRFKKSIFTSVLVSLAKSKKLENVRSNTSGSLLSERWILSAARCYNSRNISNLNIEYGNTEITPGPIGTNKARISRIIAHEDFKPSPPVNDICLVESDTDIVTGFHEPFAKLVVSGGSRNFFSGTPSVHAGWGHVNQGVRTTTLQKADNAILSLQECFDATAETQKPARNNICAVGSSVICSGDLGLLTLSTS